MAAVPECKKCGDYVFYGPILCDVCSQCAETTNNKLLAACKRALEDIGETERMTWQAETFKILTDAIYLAENIRKRKGA